jgi:hypothetical protein
LLKHVLLVGSKGSMGQRYTAVLKALGVRFTAVDKDDPWPSDYDGAIVATPTATHAEIALTCVREGAAVLVEKPISTSNFAAHTFCDEVDKLQGKVRMVNQYLHMPRHDSEKLRGITAYNYFRHGSDGIFYDCISILALASGPVHLAESSPEWLCAINGAVLRLSDMDKAYEDMVARFVSEPPEGPETAYIRMAQDKVAKMAKEHSVVQ